MGIRRIVTSRALLFLANGAIIATVLGVAILGSSNEASAVMSAPLNGDAQRLEAETATDPTPTNVASLAMTYVDRKQPGLAIALLDRHAEMAVPEIRLARARALYADGKAHEALGVLDELASQCDDSQASDPCPTWVVMKSLHERAFFSEMVRAGIEDPARDPEGTQAAFERSNREVGLVAVR